MRFIIDCGGIEPIGYRCGEIEIIREQGEPEKEFKSRCEKAVQWPIGENPRHIFKPIYSV